MSARGLEDVLYCPRPIIGVQSIDPALSKVLQWVTASHLLPEAADVATSPLSISDENHDRRGIRQSAKIGGAFEHRVLGGTVSRSKIAGLRHTKLVFEVSKRSSYPMVAGEGT